MIHNRILITGATGYIGGRLIFKLLEEGYTVRCIVRQPEYLKSRVPDNVEIVRGDLMDYHSIESAMKDCDAAFYLVHALGAKDDWVDLEKTMVEHFVRAAETAQLKQLIYLGGLVSDSKTQLSEHFQTRLLTETKIMESRIPSICFRASIILGCGSASFDLVRSLVVRLPIMLIPKWVRVHAQPIYVDDTVAYLNAALKLPNNTSEIVEIGGADVVSYLDIMKGYAKLTHRRRLFIPVPFLTPYLSSLWLGLITPIYARIGRKLIASITVPSVVSSNKASQLFPSISPLDFNTSLKLAIEEKRSPISNWSSALSSSRGKIQGKSKPNNANLLQYSCSKRMKGNDALVAFTPIREIGGKRGWYFMTSLWYLRGFIDLIFGGIGTRRARRDTKQLAVGDTLDWWRVAQYEDGELLLLQAEMKLPGYAWLEFKLSSPKQDQLEVTQTAYFEPSGLLGVAYWYLLYPLHVIMFQGMLWRITRLSTRLSNEL